MEKITYKELLEAGVHFGHLRKKRDPRMAPYIFMEKKGIHIIDLNKSVVKLQEAGAALRSIARSGKKILFVATKKQAKSIVEQAARNVNMPYITERWLGGMLTNFSTIRKSIKKMQTIESLLTDKTVESITKKERLTLSRERDKLDKVLGGISQLNRMPAALFIVDISKEHIALAEAMKLNIPTVAMVDTNSNPSLVDFPIPANDDANKSITLMTEFLMAAIQEGLSERKQDKSEIEKEAAEAAAKEEQQDAELKEEKAKSAEKTSSSDKPGAKKEAKKRVPIKKD